ncbi:23S rRNA (uracil(1939)-C(5))-methyltransferase RlmD [soil metagenome]
MSHGPVELSSMAHGGSAVGRDQGRVVFVDGGVPGDTVTLRDVDDRGRFLKAGLGALVVPSPDRVEPPCPVFDRCGGCNWQMLSLEGQRRWKANTVADQLAHLGAVVDPPVSETLAVGPGFGYRNRIDLRVSEGQPALLERGSHRPVVIDDCPLVIEPISSVIRGLEPATEVDRVTIRASVVTGEMAVISRRSGRWEHATLHEEVAGRRFRITGRAFFQVNTTGAGALVRLVDDYLSPGPGDVLLDGYAGGGLFSVTVGSKAGRIVAVENDGRAQADLAVNAPGAELVGRPCERATAGIGRVDFAVVDPPRAGLGGDGVATLVEARPRRISYVSCDPASLARDLRLLIAAGYQLAEVVPVDLFPNTHHIEAVASLER